ncbi:hypothetical protein ZWY2020_025340 [Hordeum vulgare]|nr:hypothetical protein ZWY2020_025340 [Hordeum vulgare]
MNLVLSGTARLNVLLHGHHPDLRHLRPAGHRRRQVRARQPRAHRRVRASAPPPASSSRSPTASALPRAASTWRRHPDGHRDVLRWGSRRKAPREPEKYRLRWSDLFHTALSLVAFVTFAASHHDIVRCYYPARPGRW